MFNLDKFIADSVTFRPVSMFALDNSEVRIIIQDYFGVRGLINA